MRPFYPDSGSPLAGSPFSSQIPSALTSFADELCAMVARLFAYVGTLALIAILGVHFWDQLPRLAGDVSAPPSWSLGDHSQPGFALSAPDRDAKSVTYTILWHPQGGRKDIFSWPGTGVRPMAELEIYRLGEEAASASPPGEDLNLRMPQGDEPEAAGLIDSKFGNVALLWRGMTGPKRQHGAAGCLGFFKEIENPGLRISGWSCSADGLPAQRAAVTCMLARLTLLTSGNEPGLAELFARAELNRRTCSAGGRSDASADWISQSDNPRLRGALEITAKGLR